MSTPTPPAPIAPAPVSKSEFKQVSNYLGAAVGVIGNVLPYVTPDFLTSLGLSAATVHTVSSIVAVLLFAYREKQPVAAVPAPAGAPTNSPTNSETPK